MPRLRTCSSSWQRFSTTRVMLPVTTDSSIAVVSTSVSLVASTLEKSALALARPAMRSSMLDRSRRSNSAISGAPAADERAARVEVERLLLAHVGAAGAIHQHVADAVEHRAEREQQPVDREIPAIAEDLRRLARQRRRRRGVRWSERSRCERSCPAIPVRAASAARGRAGIPIARPVRPVRATSNFRRTNNVAKLTVARTDSPPPTAAGGIRRHAPAASAPERRPGLLQPLVGHRERRLQLLREQRDRELLEQPAELVERRLDPPRRPVGARRRSR